MAAEEASLSKLNVPQRLAVRTSLRKLRINENMPNVTFWGKITGHTRDYFIAVATTYTDRVTKAFYVSSDEGVTFSKLPEVDEFVLSKVGNAKGMFSGNPAHLYKDPNQPATEEEEEEPEEDEGDEEKAPDPSKRKLNELERVAYTVQSVDADTCVVPRGAFLMTPTGAIQANSSFAGLNNAEHSKLENYLLFRDPQSEVTMQRIRKLGVSNNFDFLDGVTQDQPQGVWVAQVKQSFMNVNLRSLLWPGYEFTMSIGGADSAYFGTYFGTGLKNDDVMFML